MITRRVPFLVIAAFLALCLTVSGVSATWVYYEGNSTSGQTDSKIAISNFHYGTLYITKTEISGGSYQRASTAKSGDLAITTDLNLTANTSSSVKVTVTFYNSTDVSYYYNKTETVSSSNDKIVYEVSGIEQKDEIPAKTYKTITVTFSYKNGTVSSDSALLSTLNFNFVVDKDSIGIVVAQTAVTRFADILNNVISSNSYQTLENAMNNRGSNASSVSYIGNVSGATDSDSALIQQLFTNEFLNMDLDGDGTAEPITLMIKRENLDNNEKTGDEYTYKGLFGINRTVKGADMAIYITSEGFSSNSLTVYAAAFTKFEDEDKWIQIVPLTKGTADANNYSMGGFGTSNSFNTDTWLSEDKKNIDTLFLENINK